jgi:hypothetical protein
MTTDTNEVSNTPRTDAEVFPIQDCNGQLRYVITTQFAKQLERELSASQEAYLKSVERDDYLTQELSDSNDDLMRTQLEMQLEIDRGEAEIERLKQWKDTLISHLMALEIYEQKHENDPSVALASYGQWNFKQGEWESQSEVERLQSQLKRAVEIAEKIWGDCSNGYEHTELFSLKEEIK